MARKNLKTILNIAALLCLLGGLLFTPSAVKAASIPVSTDADEYGEGSLCSLREAIHAANIDQPFGGCPAGSGADTIFLEANKTYKLTRTVDPTDEGYGDLDISTGMTIVGAGSGSGISTISGQSQFRVFHIAIPAGASATPVRFQHLKIQDGVATGDDTSFDGVGGGIFNYRSLLSLFDVVLYNNKASLGGGGIYNLNLPKSSLDVFDSTISGNDTTGAYTTGGGGGIFNKGTLLVQNSLIQNNKAIKTTGGGLENQTNTSARVVNVTFAGNYSGANDAAVGQSGAAIHSTSSLVVINSTIAYNTVQKAGTAAVDMTVAGSVFINTIVAKNTVVETGLTANCNLLSPAGTKNLNDDTDCDGSASAFNSDANILLGVSLEPGKYTQGYILLDGSSAIDAGAMSYTDSGSGTTYYCPGSDYRWAVRPMKGKSEAGGCDIGAYEANDYITHQPSYHKVLLPAITR